MSQLNPQTPLYFCLRVPEFSVQALLRLRPSLHKTAVAVLEGTPPLESVCAVTRQARRAGVRHGMTRTEAESFPGLNLLSRSPAEEASAAQALLTMATQFTPRLEELPSTSAFMLALDMTGSERLLGTPQRIGQNLLRATRELGFLARLAVSANLHTAACLVRTPGDRLVIVQPGAERAHLQKIPLSALEPTAELADTLHAWGLQTAGDLAALPPIEIVTRLGQTGYRLYRLARGEEPHLLVPTEAAFALTEHFAFDAPVDNLDSLLFALGPMLDQLLVRARQRTFSLASVTVRLSLERSTEAADRDTGTDRIPVLSTPGFPHVSTPKSRTPQQSAVEIHNPSPHLSKIEVNGKSAEPLPVSTPIHTRTVKPALPLNDRNIFLKLLQLDLQAHPAPAAIAAITLDAEPGPRPDIQSGLFAPQLPELTRLEVTLARLAALVGEDRVGCAVLTDTHHPENFRMARPDFQASAGRKPHSPVQGVGLALRRLRPPRLIHVRQTEGRLNTFTLLEPHTGPIRYTVERAFGPWRRSGHWWSGEAWSQEEWDITATAPDGSRLLCLLTQDLLQSQWHLAALYD